MRPALRSYSFVLCLALGCAVSAPSPDELGQDQDPRQPPGFEVPPATLEPSAPPSPQAPVALSYEADVRPLMEEYCTVCHDENGPIGAEHGVDLASFDNVVSEFEGALSEIQDESMPPDGLPLMTPEEIALLVQWAEEGFAP
jgi:hypothetical protein